MKLSLNMIPHKWKWNTVVSIGGLLIGTGVADCIFALNHFDLNQIARGLTVFSAGLTILVVMDTSKTQKDNEKIQNETKLRLTLVEEKLDAIQQSQHITNDQLDELKQLLQQSHSSNG